MFVGHVQVGAKGRVFWLWLRVVLSVLLLLALTARLPPGGSRGARAGLRAGLRNVTEDNSC